MPQVTAAVGAMDFGSEHAVAAVGGGRNGPFDRFRETGPACAAFELPVALKEANTTTGTAEAAGPLFPQQRTTAWPFRGMAPHDGILLCGQYRPPFGVGPLEWIFGCGLTIDHLPLHSYQLATYWANPMKMPEAGADFAKP